MADEDRLTEALARRAPGDGPLFAVLDGAQFDNLPRALVLGGFVHRSLYLDRGDNDPARLITAPQLLWLEAAAPAAGLEAALALIGDRPAAVFWTCPAGGEVLYRHLRGINMVMIPKALAGAEEPAAETPSAEDPAPPEDPTHRLVLLRHADANVMAQLLPGLSAPERARLIGPATRLVFRPDPIWARGQPVQELRPLPGVAAPPGVLRLSEAALQGVAAAQAAAGDQRIIAYLSATAPEYTDALSPEALHHLVRQAAESGDRIGLSSDHAQGLWAFLGLISGGALLDDPTLLAHFAADPRDPEIVLQDIYDEIIAAPDASTEDWS